MIDICRGKESEFDEIIDFIDFVFSKANRPHHFPTMYPNLYMRTDESMRNIINLREDGVIKASVLCYPRTLVVGGERLKVYGIGSVATHPRALGRGFMSTLLNYALEEMKKEGVHISNLGGRRSRYNHFGYEISGNCYGTGISYDAFKRAYPEYAPKFSFKALYYDDKEIVKACKEIYDKKPVHYEYDYDGFYLRMYRENGIMPYAVYNGDKLEGFLATGIQEATTDIREICLKDEESSSEVLFSFMAEKNIGLKLNVSEMQLPHLRAFVDISGEVTRHGSGMWNILRWKEVISAFMKRKAEYTSLEPGKIVFDIEKEGKIAVSFDGDGKVTVESTDEKADIVLKGMSATRAFFGPSPEAIFGFSNENRVNILLKSWFPLPLTWYSTEDV